MYSPVERQIISKVKQGILSDANSSPFDENKWYKRFYASNKDGMDIKSAPVNVPLMVVTESLGTMYANGRGTSAYRGSIIVKLDNNIVNCIDAYTLYRGTGLNPVGLNGVFQLEERPRGKVKRIADVIA